MESAHLVVSVEAVAARTVDLPESRRCSGSNVLPVPSFASLRKSCTRPPNPTSTSLDCVLARCYSARQKAYQVPHAGLPSSTSTLGETFPHSFQITDHPLQSIKVLSQSHDVRPTSKYGGLVGWRGGPCAWHRYRSRHRGFEGISFSFGGGC